MRIREQVCQTLVKVLNSENPQFRCLAAQALGATNSGQAIAPLLEHLWDEDPDVSYDVVTALGKLERPNSHQVTDQLLRFYAEVPYGDFRVSAIEALGQLGDNRAEDLLLQVAGERDASWDNLQNEDWDHYWDAQLKAVEALAHLKSGKAVPLLNKLIGSDIDSTLRDGCIKALAGLGEQGVRSLEEMARNAAPDLQRNMAELLPQLGQACRPLAELLLRSQDSEVKAITLAGMEHLQLEVDGKALARLRKEDNPVLRKAAVSLSLAQHLLKEKEWPALLCDPDKGIRKITFQALGYRPLPGRQALLSQGMRDSSQPVRVAALQAIDKEDGETLLPLLKDHLSHPAATPLERLSIVEALARMEGEIARQIALKALRDHDGAVRKEAMELLADWELSLDQAFLVEALRGGMAEGTREPSPRIPRKEGSEQSCSAQEKHASMEPQPPASTLDAIAGNNIASMEHAMEEEEEALTRHEAEMLALIEQRTQENEALLTPRILTWELDVRVMAAELLGTRQVQEALQPLLDALENLEPVLREEAARALGKLGDRQAVSPLIEQLGTSEMEPRLAAIGALGSLGGKKAMAALENKWPGENEFEQAALLEALANCGAPTTHPAFAQTLNSRNAYMVRIAAEALVSSADDASSLDAVLEAMEGLPDCGWGGMGEKMAMLGKDGAISTVLQRLQSPMNPGACFVLIPLLAEMMVYRAKNRAGIDESPSREDSVTVH